MKQEDLVKAFGNLQATVEALSEKVSEMRDHQDGQNDILIGLQGEMETLRTLYAEQIDQALGAVNGFEEPEDGVPEDETDDQRATRVGLLLRVSEIETLIKGRNRSAPVKRNMTDADAYACLIGEFKDLDHKEAGESMGLTYAQVYSCRLEYTFKHVHQRLRQSGVDVDGVVTPWKNRWAKK
jgi:hypothetical protein